MQTPQNKLPGIELTTFFSLWGSYHCTIVSLSEVLLLKIKHWNSTDNWPWIHTTPQWWPLAWRARPAPAVPSGPRDVPPPPSSKAAGGRPLGGRRQTTVSAAEWAVWKLAAVNTHLWSWGWLKRECSSAPGASCRFHYLESIPPQTVMQSCWCCAFAQPGGGNTEVLTGSVWTEICL